MCVGIHTLFHYFKRGERDSIKGVTTLDPANEALCMHVCMLIHTCMGVCMRVCMVYICILVYACESVGVCLYEC